MLIRISTVVFFIIGVVACTPSVPPVSVAKQTAHQVPGDTETTSTDRLIARASTLLDDGLFHEAIEIVDFLRNDHDALEALTSEQHHRLQLVEIKIAAIRTPESARDQFLALARKDLLDPQAALRLYAEISRRTGDFSGAAAIYLRLAQLFPPMKHSYYEELWRVVSQAAYVTPDTETDVFATTELEAWWELAKKLQSALTPQQQLREYLAWQEAYTSHPLGQIEEAIGISKFDELKHIAVILPEQGLLAPLANDIRSGILAAYLNSQEDLSDFVQEIRFYDSSTDPITHSITRAFENGADIVIGALSKANVALALERRRYEGPVVLMNRAFETSGRHQDIFQLSLSVEDEARIIARRLKEENRQKIIVYTIPDAWATRAEAVFEGVIGTQVEISSSQTLDRVAEITQKVGDSLGATASSDRHKELEQILRTELNFVARSRQDLDGIVAFVDTPTLEALLAALKFHFSDDIPLYVPEPAIRMGINSDYGNGTLFMVMPWLTGSHPLRQEYLASVSPNPQSEVLFAFGVDVYRIASFLSQLKSKSVFQSYTGKHVLLPNGVVVREPSWGIIAGSKAQVERYENSKLNESKATLDYLIQRARSEVN